MAQCYIADWITAHLIANWSRGCCRGCRCGWGLRGLQGRGVISPPAVLWNGGLLASLKAETTNCRAGSVCPARAELLLFWGRFCFYWFFGNELCSNDSKKKVLPLTLTACACSSRCISKSFFSQTSTGFFSVCGWRRRNARIFTLFRNTKHGQLSVF